MRACNVGCARCGVMRLSSGALDRNCCYRDGAWAGQCGPANAGWPFSWKEGFRVCHDMTLPPEPLRAHAGRPFLPLSPWLVEEFEEVEEEPTVAPPASSSAAASTASSASSASSPTTSSSAAASASSTAASTAAASTAAASTAVVASAAQSNASVASIPIPTAVRTAAPSGRLHRLHVYLLTLRPLQPLRPALRHLRRQLAPPRPGATWRVAVTALRGVRARDALRVARVPPERARAVFGPQADEREFASALGCTLSHLRACRRALRDGASPALILEDDAVLDLRPFWPTAGLAPLIAALPSGWQLVQLAIVARADEWEELRAAWRVASRAYGSAPLLRRDFYWSSAAYLLHERGARALLRRFRNSSGGGDDSGGFGFRFGGGGGGGGGGRGGGGGGGPPPLSPPRWQLGSDTVRCIQADTCVLYPVCAAVSNPRPLASDAALLPALLPHTLTERDRDAPQSLAAATYVATPPLFTCAERARSSSIAGHADGEQREVHVLSRWQVRSPPICP